MWGFAVPPIQHMWFDLLLFLGAKECDLYLFIYFFKEKISEKWSNNPGGSCICSTGVETILSVRKHYTNSFWPVDGCLPTPKLSPPCLQSAGLKCQPLHAGCQNTKRSAGPDTSKRSGPCGAVPGKHAVQQSGLRRDRSASEAFSQWLVPFALAWQALLGHSICWSWRKSLPLYPFLTSSVENLPEIKKRNSSRGLVKLEPVYPSFLLRGQTQRQSCRWQSTLVLVSQVGLPSRPGLSPAQKACL